MKTTHTIGLTIMLTFATLFAVAKQTDAPDKKSNKKINKELRLIKNQDKKQIKKAEVFIITKLKKEDILKEIKLLIEKTLKQKSSKRKKEQTV